MFSTLFTSFMKINVPDAAERTCLPNPPTGGAGRDQECFLISVVQQAHRIILVVEYGSIQIKNRFTEKPYPLEH
jgi:hypothetical protein